MPELPEVEVTRLGLLPHLAGRRVTGVRWSNRRLRRPMPRRLLREWIENGVITTIDRRAKYLLVRMQGGAVLVVHLGMTGRLGIFAAPSPGARHDHLCLRLDNDREVRFNDSRRFGSVTVWPADEAGRLEEEFAAGLGIEPFSDHFNAANLLALAEKRRLPVKSFLMDSRIIAGIGNIYASEILHAAGLHPLTPVNRIHRQQWQQVVTTGRAILEEAIRAGGSTIADFLDASGQPGYFQLRLRVYGRGDLPCPDCGRIIEKTALAGRATFFCPGCQPLPRE
ncbi:MAG TPA: bifunctional DNA-formamidopyrimidine glycosylase/DNA-(apurinic or apyrimidinic site) lyase [Desulfobulbus sp.]|nr:bifunctional DNA-formamidopyrimidine glycosylase/DNA-(apurinic or apyrimidinic site) lyase [Desulfobulbus sp.]